MMRSLVFRRIQVIVFTGLIASGMNAQGDVLDEIHVSDSTGYSYKQPSISVSMLGDLAISWENIGGNGIWLKTLSAEQGTLSEVKRVIAPFNHDRTWTKHNGNGEFMLMYSAFGGKWDLYAQLYDPDGNAIGDTFNISSSYEGYLDVINASLNVNDRNEYVIMIPGLDSVMVERVSESGDFVGKSLSLKPDMSGIYGLKGVSIRHGGFVLSWSSLTEGNIFVRQFDANGEPAGGSIQVTELEIGHSVNNHKIKCDTTGNFVVVWEETFEGHKAIYAQLFSSSGTKIGNREAMMDQSGVYSGQMSVDMDLDGDYAAAWSDGRRGDTTFIYIQQINKSGLPEGGNYKATSVNDFAAMEGFLTTQTGSALQLLNDTIYLVWQNVDPTTYYTSEIYAGILKWKLPDATNISTERDQGGISIYPNPTSGLLTVHFENELTNSRQFILYNSRGMIIRQVVVPDGVRSLHMDLTQEPAGLYFLRLTGPVTGNAAPLILLDD